MGWLFWQVVEAERRDGIFYARISLLWGMSAKSVALFLNTLFGKKILQTHPQGIVYGFQSNKEVRIAWQDILKIDCYRQQLYRWSVDYVVIYTKSSLGSTKVIRRDLYGTDLLRGGVKGTIKRLEAEWRTYRGWHFNESLFRQPESRRLLRS